MPPKIPLKTLSAQKKSEEIKISNGSIRQVTQSIIEFSVNYSDLHDSKLIDAHRETLLMRFETLLQHNSSLLKNTLSTTNIVDDLSKIKAEISKKVTEINRSAKRQKLKIFESTKLSTEDDAIRYRLTRKDIEILIKRKQEKRDINCHVIDGIVPFSVRIASEITSYFRNSL